MDLSELEYMVTIAESSSLSEAAQKLFISQPAISRFIKVQEEKAGILFFQRTNKYLHITAAGELYVNKARKILQLRDEYEMELAELTQRSRAVSLHIGVQALRSAKLITNIYSFYPSFFPGGKVLFSSGNRSQLLELLAARKLDFIIINDINLPASYERYTIRSDRLLLVSSADRALPSMPAQPYSIVDLRELKNEKFFLLDKQQSMRALVDEMLSGSNIKLKNTEQLTRHEASINLAAIGHGLSFTLDSYLDIFQPPHPIRCYAIKQYLSPVPYSLVCYPGHLSSDVKRKCMKMLESALY